MPRTFEEDLRSELQDPESARIFGGALAKSSFAITLASARKTLGVTQREIAERARVSQAYIAKLEGGEANPTLEKIGSLLAVLNLSLTTGTTTLFPYNENTWETIWAADDDSRNAEINYERSLSVRGRKLVEFTG